MALHRVWLVALLIISVVLPGAARQDATPVEVRARLQDYLVAYERDLGSVIAEERMQQWPSGGVVTSRTLRESSKRTFVSEVAFVPLGGGAGWLGYRDVREVNGRTLRRTGPSLSTLLAGGSADAGGRARQVLIESARYNLGAARTINLPSLPLELLHARHQARFVTESARSEDAGRCRATRLELVESARPTIIQRPAGGDMPSRVSAWVEQKSGRLCRAEVQTRDAADGTSPFTSVIRVEFADDPRLRMMVPTGMTERFFMAPRGEGESEATYSNYRRFTTSGRLVPPG